MAPNVVLRYALHEVGDHPVLHARSCPPHSHVRTKKINLEYEPEENHEGVRRPSVPGVNTVSVDGHAVMPPEARADYHRGRFRAHSHVERIGPQTEEIITT
jgi:hypothetical protein